ncbi:MAG: helix-turn-helix transcriptional regulator [Clostridia bacterium]|nr:helix-turn-helix transcriptional regulator [Clostridia bacterium]
MRPKKEINVQVGNAIRAARERAGLTQEQFGELVDLGTKNVSDIERGVTGITLSTLKRICESLYISSDDILFYDRQKTDITFLSERLEKLSPKQYEAVQTFLNQTLFFYASMDKLK